MFKKSNKLLLNYFISRVNNDIYKYAAEVGSFIFKQIEELCIV